MSIGGVATGFTQSYSRFDRLFVIELVCWLGGIFEWVDW